MFVSKYIMMLKYRFLFAALFFATFLFGQNNNHPTIPENGLPEFFGEFRPLTLDEIEDIPELDIQASRRNNLPSRVDNSTNKYFRGIILQKGGSCSQASGIAYNFTYQINYLRNLDSKDSANQYPSHFTYNFLNKGSGDNGSNYTDGWEIVKENGCPNLIDYGGLYPIGNKGWMSGFVKYWRAMNNRVLEYYRIDVSDEEGLLELKQYLYDYGNGSPVGGIVNYSAGVAAVKTRVVAKGQYEEFKKIVVEYSDPVDHAMTFVGYDDSVRFDFNNDGKFTNDIDINDDGEVNLQDWEIGAMIVANTWGTDWLGGNDGKVYCPYRLLAISHKEGGISNSQVYTVIPISYHQPTLLASLTIKHSNRSKLEIIVGVSEDIADTSPAFQYKYMAYDNRGGAYPMDGFTDDSIIIGLDMEPLLHQKNFEVNKFFLGVKESDKDQEFEGTIHSFEVYDLRKGFIIYSSPDSLLEIRNNTTTWLSAMPDDYFPRPYNLTTTNISSDSVLLTWNKPEVQNKKFNYRIEVNGKYGGYTNDTFSSILNVENGSRIRVKAVYYDIGKTSPPSNTVFISGLEKFPVASSGSALSFDGRNDCINCGDSFNLVASNFSIEFWAKRSAKGGNQFVIGHGKVKATHKGLHIGFRNNKLMCGFWGDDVHTDDPYYDDDWHHWAITYDTSSYMQTIYRDGEIAGERKADTHYLGTETLYIGCMNNDRWWFDGLLDEIRIWKKNPYPRRH
jgi:hypothetical protein